MNRHASASLPKPPYSANCAGRRRGTGLFLGIGGDSNGGASCFVGGVAGIIAFLIMRQLGEMVVEEPVSGSFAHFHFENIDYRLRVLSGWNYWVTMFVSRSGWAGRGGHLYAVLAPDVPAWKYADGNVASYQPSGETFI